MKILATMLFAVCLTSCAGMPRETDAARLARVMSFAGAPVGSIPYIGHDRGFDVVDDQHILLTTRPRQVWLLELMGPCLRMDAASPSLQISSMGGRISAGLDRVSSNSQPGMTCIVKRIRPVDLQAMNAAHTAGAAR